MPELRIELPAETLDALESECDLLGFESPAEYVRWVVKNRASIDQGLGNEELLSSYAERINELEARLDALETLEAGSEPPESAECGSPEASGVDGRTAAVNSGSSSVAGGSDRSGDGSHTSRVTTDDGLVAENFTPERVQRVTDDDLTTEVESLSGVVTDRLDELTRRAVAKTRKRLDRDVETGLEYRSNTTIDAEDVKPGEDIADLDALPVPGHDEALRRSRRELGGRALAFLRDEGRARRGDFVDALYQSHPAGYESEAGWWNCVQSALESVDAVEAPEPGGQIWRFDR